MCHARDLAGRKAVCLGYVGLSFQSLELMMAVQGAAAARRNWRNRKRAPRRLLAARGKVWMVCEVLEWIL